MQHQGSCEVPCACGNEQHEIFQTKLPVKMRFRYTYSFVSFRIKEKMFQCDLILSSCVLMISSTIDSTLSAMLSSSNDHEMTSLLRVWCDSVVSV